MADEERVVLVIDNGNLSAVLTRLQGLNQDHRNIAPLYDRDYDFRADGDYEGFIHGDDIHEVVDRDPYDIYRLIDDDFERESRSYYTDESLTKEELQEERQLRDAADDCYYTPYGSCDHIGLRKLAQASTCQEAELFGHRRWTDSKDHRRRRVRSCFFRKARLLQSTTLTDHDSADPLDAFLDEDEMAEVVMLSDMGFHDLAAQI